MPSQIGIGELIRSDVSRTHNFFNDLVFKPRLVHYVHTMENQGTVSHSRFLLIMFFLCTVIHMMIKMFPEDMIVKHALAGLCVNTISQV